jgi:hypothetical protein
MGGAVGEEWGWWMVAAAIARPGATTEGDALIASRFGMLGCGGQRGQSAHGVGKPADEWRAEGGVRLVGGRSAAIGTPSTTTEGAVSWSHIEVQN